MNIKQVKKAFTVLKQAGITPLLVGQAGTGKTESVYQYAAENGYEVVPVRLGQASDAGDLLGLADFREVNGEKVATNFFPPNFLYRMQKNPEGKYIFFLDEINRCPKDLIQFVFQLVYEGEISLNGFKLNEHSFVIAAMNPPTEDYDVLDFQDEAFADRFCHIKFEPTVKEWLEYTKNKGICPSITSFITEQRNMLEPKLSDFTVAAKPSRRTWEAVNRVKEITGNNKLFQEILFGLVGTEAATSYITHLNKVDKDVDPKMILNNFKKVKDQIVYLSNPENSRSDIIKNLNDKIHDELINLKELNRVQEENIVEYLMTIPKDAAYAALNQFAELDSFGTTETDKESGLCSGDANNDLAVKLYNYVKTELTIAKEENESNS